MSDTTCGSYYPCYPHDFQCIVFCSWECTIFCGYDGGCLSDYTVYHNYDGDCIVHNAEEYMCPTDKVGYYSLYSEDNDDQCTLVKPGVGYPWDTGQDPPIIQKGEKAKAEIVQEIHEVIDIIRGWVGLEPYPWENSGGATVVGNQLITNPTFDPVDSVRGYVGGLAPHWTTFGSGVSTYEIKNDNWQGQSSQRIALPAKTTARGLRSNSFSVEKDNVYELQFALKVISGTLQRVQLRFDDNSYQPLFRDIRAESPFNDWYFFRKIFTCEKNSHLTTVEFSNVGLSTSCSFIIDGVRIREYNKELPEFSPSEKIGDEPPHEEYSTGLCGYDLNYWGIKVFDVAAMPTNNEIIEMRQVLQACEDNNLCLSVNAEHYIQYTSNGCSGDCGCDGKHNE